VDGEEDEDEQLERVLAESAREAEEEKRKRLADDKKREEDEMQQVMQLSVIEAGGRLDDNDSHHPDIDSLHEPR